MQLPHTGVQPDRRARDRALGVDIDASAGTAAVLLARVSGLAAGALSMAGG